MAKVEAPIYTKYWFKAVVSLASILLIAITWAFTWKSLYFIFYRKDDPFIEKAHNNSHIISFLSYLIQFFSGDVVNVFVILFYVAMFKKRGKAFSFTVLWFLESFTSTCIALSFKAPDISCLIPLGQEGNKLKTGHFSNPSFTLLSFSCLTI